MTTAVGLAWLTWFCLWLIYTCIDVHHDQKEGRL
jgi:hypothetical protein